MTAPTMTLRQIAWFIAGYVAIVALSVWFNLAILCQGDAKYDQGCGGFGVYIPLWEIFLIPLAVAAILLESWRASHPPPTRRLLAYLAGILLVAEAGFLLIEKFPVLLATQAAVIGVAAVVRWRTTRHRVV